jgi:uncharacterized protein YdeI (YjbR/CyaY-like superfamily)
VAGLTDREQVHLETRQAWRAWLGEHHATSAGVWLVSWKASTGRPRVTYDEAVEEALCVGWVDSRPGSIDDERSRLWFAPRSPGSAWSRVNKERVERLLAAGLVLPAGLAVIKAARASGAWNRLDDVEDLVVPPDLAAAFEAHPGAQEQWEGFPRSEKRRLLEWITQARTEPTRAKRVTETAAKAAVGERANLWRPKP